MGQRIWWWSSIATIVSSGSEDSAILNYSSTYQDSSLLSCGFYVVDGSQNNMPLGPAEILADVPGLQPSLELGESLRRKLPEPGGSCIFRCTSMCGLHIHT